MPLRVVLDTNILVSALVFPAGRRARIWTLAQQRSYKALTSPAIIAELARILRDSFEWEEPRVRQTIRAVAHKAEAVALISLPKVVRDPKDDHIIACAIDGKADAIVSGDNDLLVLGNYQNIPVIHPADFLRMFGE